MEHIEENERLIENVDNIKNDKYKNLIWYIILVLLIVFMIIGCGIPTVSIMMHNENITGSDGKIYHVSEFMTGLWRQEFIAIGMIPLALIQLIDQDNRNNVKESIKNKINILKLIVSSIGYTGWLYSVFAALQFTSIAHAVLFSNLHCVIIVFKKIITKTEINKFEIIGTIFTLFGSIFIMIFESILSKNNIIWYYVLIGDLIALSGSLFAFIYLEFSAQFTQKGFPIFLLLLLNNWIAFYVGILIGTLAYNATLSRNLIHGWFGWMNTKWIYYLLFLGGITGILGASILVLSTKFLDSLLISILYVSEPVFAVIIGLIFKIEKVPQWYTIFGSIFILIGLILVILGSKKKI